MIQANNSFIMFSETSKLKLYSGKMYQRHSLYEAFEKNKVLALNQSESLKIKQFHQIKQFHKKLYHRRLTGFCLTLLQKLVSITVAFLGAL